LEALIPTAEFGVQRLRELTQTCRPRSATATTVEVASARHCGETSTKNCAKRAHKPRSRATAVGLRRIRLLDLRLVALACGIGRTKSGLAWPHAPSPKKTRFR